MLSCSLSPQLLHVRSPAYDVSGADISTMSVLEMVFKRRDENILRAIERITSVYSLAWEIKGDIKEVHGTLGFDRVKQKNWSRTERNFALFKLHQFLPYHSYQRPLYNLLLPRGLRDICRSVVLVIFTTWITDLTRALNISAFMRSFMATENSKIKFLSLLRVFLK